MKVITLQSLVRSAAAAYRTLARPAVLVGLLASLALAGTRTASASGAELQIDYLRMFTASNGQVSDRAGEWKITNIGDQEALVLGRLDIQTRDGKVHTEQVGYPQKLKPKESQIGYFQLDQPCDGTLATVAFEIDGAPADTIKRLGPVKLCPDLPAAMPAPAPSGGPDDTEIDYGGGGAPERPKPAAQQTRDIPWQHTLVEVRDNRGGGIPYANTVGYSQYDKTFGVPGIGDTYSLAFDFDNSKFQGIPADRLIKAWITYDEAPFESSGWTDDNGNPMTKPGCVTRIYIVNTPWVGLNVFPYDPNNKLADVDPGRHEIDVTLREKAHVQDLTNKATSYGYVLKGPFDEVHGQDNNSCHSTISNLVLHLTYQP